MMLNELENRFLFPALADKYVISLTFESGYTPTHTYIAEFVEKVGAFLH